MVAFFKSYHIDKIDVVENDNYIPVDDHNELLPRIFWTGEHKHRCLLDSNVHNSLMLAPLEEKYSKAYDFKGSKEIWNTHTMTYRGSTKITRNKLTYLLFCQYKLRSIEQNENIQRMFNMF